MLDDDALVSESQERVMEGVVRWMKGGAAGVIRSEGLLCKIRLPFMLAEFLVRGPAVGQELCFWTGGAAPGFGVGYAKEHASIFLEGKDLRYLDVAVLVPGSTARKGGDLGRACGEEAHRRPNGVLCVCLWQG